MSDAAGWIALAATSIAALMTAANLGARVTGWGFAVFAIGAVAWIVVGAATGQAQLLWSNVFLGLVDLIGVWRWLVVRAKAGDAVRAEEKRSVAAAGDDRFSVAGLDGREVKGAGGRVLATAVDALAACEGGRIDFLVVRAGGVAGVGGALHRLPWRAVRVRDAAIETDLDAAAFDRLPRAEAG